MTIRHAPLFVIALPVVVTGLQLAGASATTMLFALLALAVPVLSLLLLPGDVRTPRPRPSEHRP
ncbi:hypothetical protein [Nocardia sp. NPDC127526]|uniref:hypothetical protein n=1 Tax=Nocardia sp. NPDC127526 TaxID=3345393 RepID=UPI00362B2D4E